MKIFRFAEKTPIKDFLERIGRPQYADKFMQNGLYNLKSLGNYINNDRNVLSTKITKMIGESEDVSYILKMADKEMSRNAFRNVFIFIMIFILLIALIDPIMNIFY